jgi:hypothetical protein
MFSSSEWIVSSGKWNRISDPGTRRHQTRSIPHRVEICNSRSAISLCLGRVGSCGHEGVWGVEDKCFRTSTVADRTMAWTNGLWKRRTFIFAVTFRKCEAHSERPWNISSFVYAAILKAALRHIRLSLCAHIERCPEAHLALFMRPHWKRPWCICSFVYTATLKAALGHIRLCLFGHIESGPEAYAALFMRPHWNQPWGISSFVYAATLKAVLRHI